jgi:hypothetical protein
MEPILHTHTTDLRPASRGWYVVREDGIEHGPHPSPTLALVWTTTDAGKAFLGVGAEETMAETLSLTVWAGTPGRPISQRRYLGRVDLLTRSNR